MCCWSFRKGIDSEHRRADPSLLCQPGWAAGVGDLVGAFACGAAGVGDTVLALVVFAATSATTGWPGTVPFVVVVCVALVATCGPGDVGVHWEFHPHKWDGDVGGRVGGCESQENST